MSTDNQQPNQIDIETWRLEVKNFAEQIRQSLNSVGEMLRTGKTETETEVITEVEELTHQIDGLATDLSQEEVEASGGRLDQLRAKLAQKISEKNN